MTSVERIPIIYPANKRHCAILRHAKRCGIPEWTMDHPEVKKAKYQAYEDWLNTPNNPRKVPVYDLKTHLDQVGLFAISRVKTGIWAGH